MFVRVCISLCLELRKAAVMKLVAFTLHGLHTARGALRIASLAGNGMHVRAIAAAIICGLAGVARWG